MIDPASKPSEHHWADCPAEEWSREYFSRINKGGSFLARLQLLAHRHFYGALPTGYVGDLPSSAEVTREGAQGENVELRVNWLRAHANAKHQIIVAPKLAWGSQAVNTDSKTLADAARGSSILEAEWKQGPWERAAIDAQLGAGIYGEEFLFPYWSPTAGAAKQYEEAAPEVPAHPGSPAVPPSEENPQGAPEVPPREALPARAARIHYAGDLVCHQVPSWNAFCDERAQSWDASSWKSVRIPMDRWDLIAQFPDRRDEILSVAAVQAVTTLGPTTSNVVTQPDKDRVLCHYFFHKRTPGLPSGLQAIALSEKVVLSFEPLEPCYFVPPIHQATGGTLKGSPRGYTDFWEAMAAQDLATNIQGSLATNIVAFAKQMISAEEGTNLNIDQIGNGPFVQYRKPGTQPPTPMMFHQADEGAFKHLDTLKGDQRMMLGLNDVAMGEAPTGTPNAQAWALLATAGVTANSGGQRSFVDLVRKTGQSILSIWKHKVDEKRKTSIVGLYGAAVPRQEEWDKSDMEPMGDVTVDIANPLAQTAAGRLQLEQLYADRGFVQVPEQLEQILSAGTLQPLTQVLRNELIFIASENEAFLKGECPPVMLIDSHQMHIREHKDAMFMPQGRLDPKVIDACNKHINDHVQQALAMAPQLAQLLGQASAAPPPPPGASGPGGPPKPPTALEQPGQPGAAPEGIKLPTPPTNPATGAPAGSPGVTA